MKKNPLQEFIDGARLTVRSFGVAKGIKASSLYPIYNGTRKPGRRLALLILDATDGAVKLEHWGYEF